jgi:hypothetical protein
VGGLAQTGRDLARLPARIGKLAQATSNTKTDRKRLHRQLRSFDRRLRRLDRRLERIERLTRDQLRGMLFALVAEDADNRRRLYGLRGRPEYAQAFVEDEPLVSVSVPTLGRPELFSRSLPSILNQSYERLEVIVVGDHTGPEVAHRVASLGDPRVIFRNLTQRLVLDNDPRRHHRVGSTMARNEAFRMATGQWLVAFDDDDLMYPDHVRTLLEAARSQRLEVAYGRYHAVYADGIRVERGFFPPAGCDNTTGKLGESFHWQSALYHQGLRFFERELVAVALRRAGDDYLAERMLRAGVRFGMVDDFVCEYRLRKPAPPSGRP